jgi:predicted XRE-type DNA-binding protein
MSNQTFLSVWDAIKDTPEQAENMKLRSVLMMAIKDHIVRAEMSQAQAAKRFGVSQPRVSDLMRGKINLFALDALVDMAVATMRIEVCDENKPVGPKKASVKVVDSGGQISLGKEYAGQEVLVEECEPCVWLMRIAPVIPENEAWMHTPAAGQDLQEALIWAQANPPQESTPDTFFSQ